MSFLLSPVVHCNLAHERSYGTIGRVTPVTQERRTRDAILERAVDLASEQGLEALTIGRLASEMEMSKSGLFGHFGSKQDLQLATVEAASRRFVNEVVVPLGEHESGPERLRALCDNYLGYMERQVFPGGCFWASVTHEFDNRPGPVRDLLRERMEAWLKALEAEARGAGFDDPAQIAFEVHSAAQGANSAFQLLGDREAFARARAAIDRRLVAG
jgi:AcrR family transcriptional regulator